ncbi:MAG TPA: methyltransferase [Euzebyales bacterium]|nr:methyltransferase [Euzebyales bacterium]
MAAALDTARHAVRGFLLRLKGFSYSGFARDRWQQPDRVLAALAIREGDRVADLGAGAGYFTFRLARAVGPQGVVYAVDTDPGMSSLIAGRVARDTVTNVVIVAAAPDDPALPEPVDLVLLVNAFHHLPDPADYLTTLSAYLRPGGRVAVIEAYPKWFLFGHATTPEAIAATLREAGYTGPERPGTLRRQSFQIFQRAV